MFEASKLFYETRQCSNDIIVHQGGSSSGKTYSILQVLFTKAIEERVVITVVGESIPNLKAGALRDAIEIVNSSDVLKSLVTDYNKTERIFTFEGGSVMEFKSYLTPQDAKSGKRDYLFINEAQGISYAIFNELYMRTKIQCFVDYNPNEEFWVHEKLLGTRGVKLFISDHRHNPFVPEKIREKLEDLKNKDMELFKVYARGMTGKIEGLIFRNFGFVDAIPKEAKFIAHYLDWGFTNDPTAFGSVYKMNGELFIDEKIYTSGLTNSDIINKLKELTIHPNDEIIADSSEPKSIEDIRRAGYFISGANKGPDSIVNSIDTLKPFKLNITNTSVGLKKEIKSYKWQIDATGKTINKPVDYLNHSIDGVRYVALNKLKGSGEFDYSFA